MEFFRKAADIYTELRNLAKEGLSRSNAALTLIHLKRYDEARPEVERAIKCNQPFGKAAEPWKTFDAKCDLERAVGNTAAAAKARQQAVQAYLAYRRDGGENLSNNKKIFTIVAEVLHTGQIDAAAIVERLSEFSKELNLPNGLKPLISALQAVLRGSRDPALAADPDLNYNDAAELLLLLESLAAHP